MAKLPLRSMFIAEPGTLLITVDLSQAESWIVAYLTNDKAMQHDLKYGDIHTSTGCYIYNCGPEELTKDQRYLGKRSNHMLGYGATYLRFVQVVNKDGVVTISNPEGNRIVEAWHQKYSVRAWHREIQAQLYKDRTLKNAYGRKRIFYGNLNDETFKAAYAHIPQSTVADHTNGLVHPQLGVEGGVLGIHKRICSRPGCKLLNQSHDSVLLQAPKTSAMAILQEVHSLMQRPLIVNGEEFIIPADGEIGERMGEYDKVKLPNPYREAA